MKKRTLSLALAVFLCGIPAMAAQTRAVTEEEVYADIVALEDEYAAGTPWDNSNYYAWEGGIYSGGYGCAGFAFLLSDAAFGTLEARMVEEFAYEDIRVGDILRINGDTHSVVVLEVFDDHVVIAEGNFNSAVSWERTLSAEDVMAADYMITRYPDAEEPADVQFTDVYESDWYYDTVHAAAGAGIIAGSTDGSFDPCGELSWAQAVTFAVRLAQYKAGEPVYSAADQTDVWYQIYVSYAIEHGIIPGMEMQPDTKITRGDAAMIFAEVLGDAAAVNTLPDDYFTDVAYDSFLKDAVYALAEAGICNGTGGGTFGVNDTFLRCEAAAIAARMAGLTEPARIAG